LVPSRLSFHRARARPPCAAHKTHHIQNRNKTIRNTAAPAATTATANNNTDDIYGGRNNNTDDIYGGRRRRRRRPIPLSTDTATGTC
jgi:hypothetical protein